MMQCSWRLQHIQKKDREWYQRDKYRVTKRMPLLGLPLQSTLCGATDSTARSVNLDKASCVSARRHRKWAFSTWQDFWVGHLTVPSWWWYLAFLWCSYICKLPTLNNEVLLLGSFLCVLSNYWQTKMAHVIPWRLPTQANNRLMWSWDSRLVCKAPQQWKFSPCSWNSLGMPWLKWLAITRPPQMSLLQGHQWWQYSLPYCMQQVGATKEPSQGQPMEQQNCLLCQANRNFFSINSKLVQVTQKLTSYSYSHKKCNWLEQLITATKKIIWGVIECNGLQLSSAGQQLRQALSWSLRLLLFCS